MPYTLTNFNAPVAVRKRFDAVCRASGRTRTSVLIELMSEYVLREGKRQAQLEQEFSNLDTLFLESSVLMGSGPRMDVRHRSIHSRWQTRGDRDFDLPDPIFPDSQEDW